MEQGQPVTDLATRNPALTRSLCALSHPISRASVGVLLLNDHVLRRWWPSWITGKLGDVAWLAFFPLIMALVFALIVPARVKRRDQVVAGLAFGFTALLFALGKTVPAVHALIVAVLGAILHIPIGLRLDPTDLLALPALWIGWRVWWADRGVQPRAMPRRGWAVLALGALATMGNSIAATPPEGITCLLQDENETITAMHSFGGEAYKSNDGGLTWRAFRFSPDWGEEPVPGCPDAEHEGAWQLVDPNNELVLYTFIPGERILRSDDGGQNWIQEIGIKPSEAQSIYYDTRQGWWTHAPAPIDAEIHHSTGNLVVAMGYEGVLIRDTDGDWRWVAVGIYHRERFSSIAATVSLLGIEILMAFTLAFLAITGLYLLVVNTHSKLIVPVLFIIFVWMYFVLSAPALTYSIYAFLLVPIAWVLLAFSALLGVISLSHVDSFYNQTPREFWLTPLLAGVIFLVPYILWVHGIIPLYWLANSLALVLSTIVMIRGTGALQQ
jgi:hypothetical protein